MIINIYLNSYKKKEKKRDDLCQVSLACLFGYTIVDAWSKNASKEELKEKHLVGRTRSNSTALCVRVAAGDLHS